MIEVSKYEEEVKTSCGDEMCNIVSKCPFLLEECKMLQLQKQLEIAREFVQSMTTWTWDNITREAIETLGKINAMEAKK